MAKIADVVKLKTGYANFVELKSAFEETQENAERMAMYRPTNAHRKAFERLSRGLYQPNDKKFYLLSGSYGTGKSHLCLMFANFLSRASGDPEIKGFYENYEKLDSDTAKMLKNIRKGGQYLVAICDYHSGKKFEDVVLKAIFDACQAKGLDGSVQTEFDEAERLLTDWKQKSDDTKTKTIRNFYEDFEKALEKVAPALSVEQLRSGLKDYDSESLERFRSAFQETMGGIEFQARSGNLIPIVRELVRSKEFKNRFKGLAILFDEFGFTLEKASYSKDVLQGFMETICKNEPNVIFVGCVHKDFKAYADRFSKEDASVMSARITTVDLLNEGIEEIISAIVETDKDSTAWKQEVEPKTGVFDQLVPVCKSLKLFPWIEDVNRIRQRVLEDIYGVHPMALACLLRLSSEIGSDARSTFTFFSGDVEKAEGSYPEFIESADLTGGGGKLNLYTVNRLFTFFGRELSLRNPELRDLQRKTVSGFYASLENLRKGEQKELFEEVANERLAVLRTILLYQLCQVPTSVENIQFGLYCLTRTEQKQAEKHLKHLVKVGAVFFRKQSKTYELAVGTGEDPYELIERYVADTSLHPKNMIEAFLEEATDPKELEFLDAKQYNLHFNEDKRFRCYFVRAKDLGTKFWEELARNQEDAFNKEKKGYEGSVVYALCEDDAEVQVAKKAVMDIPVPNIAVAVPAEPQPFTEALLKVKACLHYLPPNEAEKISAQTESRLRDVLEDSSDGFLPHLQRILASVRSGESACWYGENGKVLVDKPKQGHKPADMLCEELYKKRCHIKHADLNFVHDDKWRKGKNNALRQAVNVLLDAERVMIDKGNPDNHGEKRYLEKVLLKGAGALRKTDSEGAVTYFDCEHDPDKISDDFSVLRELCQGMSELSPGATFPLGSFLEKAKSPPFGAGGTALTLALAHVVRAFGERLRIYKDSTKTVEQVINTYDDLVAVIGDYATKIVFEVQDISAPQAKLVEGIANAVGAPPLKYGETRSFSSVYEALSKWWDDLPSVAKIVDLYEKDRQKRLKKLKEIMDMANSTDRFDLLLQRLPSVYAVEPVGAELREQDAEKICEAFASDVKLLQSGIHSVRNSVAEAISEIFGSKGDMVQCETVVTEWYESLNPSQRDPLKCDDEDAQCVLGRLAGTSVAFEKKFLTLLPQDFGFDPVSEWSAIHTNDYVAKLKQAKAAIDEAKPEVPVPPIKPKPYKIVEGERLEVGIAEGASEMIYTTNNEDPKKAKDAKRVKGELNLANLLGDRHSVTISMRNPDSSGNASDLVQVVLINKSKEYEIEIVKDDLFDEKGSFIFPKDTKGLISVIRSLLSHGVKKGIVNKKEANKIKAAVNELADNKG